MGSFVPVINHKGRDHQLFAVYTYGSLEVYFYWYMFKAPFDDEAKRLDLLNRLNAIPGVKISSSAINKRPNIRLSIFKSPQSLKALLDIFDWVIHEIENS